MHFYAILLIVRKSLLHFLNDEDTGDNNKRISVALLSVQIQRPWWHY